MYYSLGYLPSKRRWYVLYRGSGRDPTTNDIMKGTSKEGYSSHEDAYVAAERTGNKFISEYELTSLKEFEVGQIIKLAQDTETTGTVTLLDTLESIDGFTVHLFSGTKFQIVQLDKEHNILYAGSIDEKGILITAPIHADEKIFEIIT